jgi:hypothetical protein
VIWYIWTRCFWFLVNDRAPWAFIRYRLYRSFFNKWFTYDQLNFIQRFFMNTFYVYLHFLPVSSRFANNYFFNMHRNYFAPLSYKMLAYEGMVQYNYKPLINLEVFSDEVLTFKNLCTHESDIPFYDLTVILNSVSNKYYLVYYMVYTKSFYEFEEFNENNVSSHSLNLMIWVAYTSKPIYNDFHVYNLNTAFGFFNYVSKLESFTNVTTTPILPHIQIQLDSDEFLINYYKKLAKIRQNYIKRYFRFLHFSFFFGSARLSKLLVLPFNPSTYININLTWLKTLKKRLYIRFSDSSVSKYISFKTLNKYKIYYIRKNRIFNKGRYSRNRQLYRTGVYWCLWLNVIVVYGLYFFFYRFTFNFGYLWLGLALLAFSFIFSRVCQSRFYNPTILLTEFQLFLNWVFVLFQNCYSALYNLYLNFFDKYLRHLYFNIVLLQYVPMLYSTSVYKAFLFFSESTRKQKSSRFVFYWQYFVGEDKSFLKIKTKIHWFKQLWKMLTT